jgi:hypothetical protein
MNLKGWDDRNRGKTRNFHWTGAGAPDTPSVVFLLFPRSIQANDEYVEHSEFSSTDHSSAVLSFENVARTPKETTQANGK